MNHTFKLLIHSLSGVVFDSDIKSISLKTTAGPIEVLARHIDLIGEVVACSARITNVSNEILNVNLTKGFFRVNQHSMTIWLSESV